MRGTRFLYNFDFDSHYIRYFYSNYSKLKSSLQILEIDQKYLFLVPLSLFLTLL